MSAFKEINKGYFVLKICFDITFFVVKMEECVTESETELAEGNKTQVDQVRV